MLIVLVISVAITTHIKYLTQNSSDERIQPTIGAVMFQRIVWPKLEKNYGFLPDNIKQIITLEDARQYDENRNYINILLNKVLEDGLEWESINETTKIIAMRDAFSVFWYILKDFTFNIFSPIVYNVQPFFIADTIEWTQTRMNEHSLYLTQIYYHISQIIYFSILIYTVVLSFINKEFIRNNKIILILISLCLILQSGYYTLIGGSYGFHIRYQLWGYAIGIMTIVILFIEINNKNYNIDSAKR